MPATGISAEALAAGRREVESVVWRLANPPASPRAKRLVDGLVQSAELARSYAMRGGTGLHSYALTMGRMERTLRDRRHALIRYVSINGGDVRRAARYARVLCSPFAYRFPDTTPRSALLFLAKVERASVRRSRAA